MVERFVVGQRVFRLENPLTDLAGPRLAAPVNVPNVDLEVASLRKGFATKLADMAAAPTCNEKKKGLLPRHIGDLGYLHLFVSIG